MEEVLEALKDMVRSRRISSDRMDAQPSQTVKGGTNEAFPRRVFGKREAGGSTPHAHALLLLNFY